MNMDKTLGGYAQYIRGLPMPELRKDPIVGRWVIIATDRAKRPVAPKNETEAGGSTFCPFCEGNEDKTPYEILAYRDRQTRSNEKGWRVRVVPNKFPALQIEGDLHKRGEGIYDKMGGIGAHEVIIECPFHEVTLANLSEDTRKQLFEGACNISASRYASAQDKRDLLAGQSRHALRLLGSFILKTL